MDAFLRDAEQILETAIGAEGGAEHLIAVLRNGSIRILSEAIGWSLPALAAEYGASAVYRVVRRGRTARVEAWSLGRTCVLTRELAKVAGAFAPWQVEAEAPTPLALGLPRINPPSAWL